MEPGRIVFSKAGRDKLKPFVVVSSEADDVYLADGKTRLLHKPKKKKLKHIQPTNASAEDIRHKLENNKYLNDSDLRKALLPYCLHIN